MKPTTYDLSYNLLGGGVKVTDNQLVMSVSYSLDNAYYRKEEKE